MFAKISQTYLSSYISIEMNNPKNLVVLFYAPTRKLKCRHKLETSRFSNTSGNYCSKAMFKQAFNTTFQGVLIPFLDLVLPLLLRSEQFYC
jgi:hypothetical protein